MLEAKRYYAGDKLPSYGPRSEPFSTCWPIWTKPSDNISKRSSRTIFMGSVKSADTTKGDVQFAKPGQYSGDRMGTRSVIRVKRASDDPVNVLIGPFTLSPFAP
jgi:hypothetical protein